MKVIGKTPVPLPLFLFGKFSLFLCLFFFIIRLINKKYLLYQSTGTDITALAFFIAGFIITTISLINLGNSTSMGLPGEETNLRINGIYKISRNPMYLGLFLLLAASCFFTINWMNIILAVQAIIVHHLIILSEEKFLKNRFGENYENYKRKVRRYY